MDVRNTHTQCVIQLWQGMGSWKRDPNIRHLEKTLWNLMLRYASSTIDTTSFLDELEAYVVSRERDVHASIQSFVEELAFAASKGNTDPLQKGTIVQNPLLIRGGVTSARIEELRSVRGFS